MKKRSKKFWFFSTLLAVVLVWTALVLLMTGGIDRGFQDNENYSWAHDMEGVECFPLTIPVRLKEQDRGTWNLRGEYCKPAGTVPKTLQILLSGAGYGITYWDFPYQPDTYSYARAALRAGDAVFNFDRLGMGLSDHPFGVSLDVDTQAFVLKQVIDVAGEQGQFEHIVTLGHSFGSTVALAHALQWPEQVDGIVLTGFIHNVNPGFGPAMGKGIDVAAFSGPVAGDLFDPTYVISKPDSRGDVFYTRDNTDEGVIATDNATRETTAAGELISMSRYFKDQSKALEVPVMVLVGENDFVVCGGDLDCTDHEAVVAFETQFYPAETCPEVNVLDDTNHNANLHLNAQQSFGLMLDWIARRVGSGGSGATQPCLN